MELLDYLVGLQTSNLQGTIAVDNSDVVTFEQKKSYLRWGDIDNPYNRLYITYTLLNIGHIFIKGQKYFNQTGTTHFDITTDDGNNVAIVNGKVSVNWSMQSNSYFEVVDAAEGIVRIKKLNEEDDKTRYTITVSVLLKNNNTVTASWKIGAFTRLPERGDFAYADGTFDDEVIGGKTMVGFVVNSSDMYIGTEVVGRSVDVCSMKYFKIQSKDTELSLDTYPWGVSIGSRNDQLQQLFVDEVSADSNNVNLSNIAVGTGANDFQSKANTRNIVDVASAVITGYISKMWRNTDITQYQESTSANQYAAMVRTKVSAQLSQMPSTIEELGDMMEAFRTKMLIDGNTNVDRYDQLFYPPALGCYLYEPYVKNDENLHSSYRSGNWFLPAYGIVNKIANFYHASRNKQEGVVPSSVYANEDQTLSDADYPLIANLLKRLEDAGVVVSSVYDSFVAESAVSHGSSSLSSSNNDNVMSIRLYNMYQSSMVTNKYARLWYRAITNFTFMI